MSILLNRRQFLTLPLVPLLAPIARLDAETRPAGWYAVDAAVFYELFTFHLAGTIDERVDRVAGRYAVTFVGEGASIANRLESRGVLRAGRWAPERTFSWVNVRGRESRTEIAYNYASGTIDYHARGETFFLRRLRVVDDRVPIPPRRHVDDVITAVQNYADDRWPARDDGVYVTEVVRRAKREDEGPDEVAAHYRAELAPLELRVAADPANGKPTGEMDLTPFSSWTQSSRPARIVFNSKRRPEVITTSMILGSSVTIRLSG